MNRESFTFNETFNTCYIRPSDFFPNGSYLDYDTCPESYTNSTISAVFECCLRIIINRLENSHLTKIQGWLAHHSSTLLIGPAIVFNLLSLLVLSRFSKLNSSATSISFYMQCLCIFDALTMLSKFLNEFILVKNQRRQQPFQINSLVCKLSYFSESIFGVTSIYILILMSIDKLICVAFPLRSSSILRPKKAKLLCLFVLLLSMMYSSYHLLTQKALVTMKQTSNTTSYECIYTDSNVESKMKIVDNFIRVFVPIILLSICNILIVIILAKSRQMFATERTSDDDVRIKYSKSNKNKEIVILNNQNNTEIEEVLSNDDNDNYNVENRKERSKFSTNESKYNQKSSRIRPKNSKADKNSHYISGIKINYIIKNLYSFI
jgi:hypothetical protein